MTQGPLPLILLSARDHPDHDFRGRIWAILETWVSGKLPRLDTHEALALLENGKGTFLEPFRVSGRDRELAALLLRLSLSEDVDLPRFRIVGEQTIGNEGGLVVTKNGKSFYSERYAFGKNKLKKSRSQFFAPSMKVEPPRRTSAGKIPPARMKATETGISIFLDERSFDRLDWISEGTESEFSTLVRALSDKSTLGKNNVRLEDLGVSINACETGIVIESNSPESLIRLSTYIVEGSQIILKGAGNYEVVLNLPKTGNGKASCTIIARDGFARNWMDVTGFGAPDLSSSDILEISKWALPHAEWTEQIIEVGK